MEQHDLQMCHFGSILFLADSQRLKATKNGLWETKIMLCILFLNPAHTASSMFLKALGRTLQWTYGYIYV
jgi:hypothetical protein